MFTRYKTDSKGRTAPVAKVYEAKEHNIHNSQIDKDALWAIRKIWASGEKAYLVGGAVRDMLLGKRPKDFDIATSASPRQIQKLFWNSRAIGRRFRIVHLFFGAKIIEVTTFRSDEENFVEGSNNIFGTIEQDARRRDFSINALYYNPLDGHLLDFTGGMDDIRKKVIRSLIPLKYSFSEDPVRMIRAVKYMCTTGFKLKWDVKRAIARDCHLIQGVATSRLTDEMGKVFASASSASIMAELSKKGLLGYIMPCFDMYVRSGSMARALALLDTEAAEAKTKGSAVETSEVLRRIAAPVVIVDESLAGPEEQARDIFRQIKVLIAPMTPPNYEIERAADLILQDRGLKAPSRRKGSGGRRKKEEGRKAQAPATQGGKPKSKSRRRRGRKSAGAGQEGPASSAEAHDL